MPNEKTLGQKRVKAEFNPSKSEIVDQIKNKSAELIDLMEKLAKGLPVTRAKARLIDIAQTNIETGCMYAVKANFTE